MKNVTITLDEKVAHWARVEAAKAGMSLSRWIGEKLRAEMPGETDDERRLRLGRLEDFLSGPGWPGIAGDLPKRDEIYAERGVYRHQRADLQPRSERGGEAHEGGGSAAERHARGLDRHEPANDQ
ncbi:hypothetical protein [Prosthecomicrobium pneumaticum]|uniref:CopG family transcriptional regulator n=1 Tax=Prosthecomicrobium pneumaticum TaxID=81895 RepID=A0A7W9CUR2_9HYPH|nr:hypothetical protein [Prosthecomicrobium pneumaticum]MBB5752004.1 hypothetical protein [Prosthecomicrobium pneumaticum]